MTGFFSEVRQSFRSHLWKVALAMVMWVWARAPAIAAVAVNSLAAAVAVLAAACWAAFRPVVGMANATFPIAARVPAHPVAAGFLAVRPEGAAALARPVRGRIW